MLARMIFNLITILGCITFLSGTTGSKIHVQSSLPDPGGGYIVVVVNEGQTQYFESTFKYKAGTPLYLHKSGKVASNGLNAMPVLFTL